MPEVETSETTRVSERRFSVGDLQNYVVYAAFLVILIVLAIFTRDDGFLTVDNFVNIGRQAAPIAVMAVGLAFALGAGEIDLSVGATVGLATLVAADAAGRWGTIPAVAIVLATGVIIGLFNGLITVQLRIPSFLVTLGTMGIVGGFARSRNDLKSLPISNNAFLDVFGRGSVVAVSVLLIWAIVVIAIGHVSLHRLRWGRHTIAVGANRDAAQAVGIHTKRVRVGALVISAIAAAFAGILLSARLGIGRHDIGEDNLLTVIAAVVIGGNNLFGGKMSIVGAAIGAIIMAMLNNGLILMGLDVSQQMMARGAIIIVAVALSLREAKEA